MEILEFKQRRDILNSDDELFGKQLSNLKKLYEIKDFDRISDLINEKRGLIIILNEVRPLLDKYVPYACFHLELDVDPLFTPQILLMVEASKKDFNNGFKEDIYQINSIIRPFLLEFDLVCEFFIFERSIRVPKSNVN